MPATNSVIGKQLYRLKNVQRNWPDAAVPEGAPEDYVTPCDRLMSELVRALEQMSISDQHCVAICEGWMRESQFAPTPADLHKIAKELKGKYIPQTRKAADLDCPDCSGTGFCWNGLTGEDSGVQRCECTRIGASS